MIQSRGGDFLNAHLKRVPPFRALIRSIECRIFEQFCPLTPPVLDVGCGDGLFAAMAFDRPVTLGLDKDFNSLKIAQAEGGYRYLVSTDSTSLPFKSSQFRTVISNCVLEHIEHIDSALGEISRVMDPEASLLFGVPSHHFGDFLLGSSIAIRLRLKGLSQRYGNWFNRHSLHFHTDDPETWINRLAQHGLAVSSWQYYMPHKSHCVFDLAHYLSIPYLLSWKLTGSWTPPGNPFKKHFDRWLRSHYLADAPDEGAYLFFACRKR